ncbi:MAG: hypothetical protein AB1627_15360 [Chloroflexota bacterium]
MLPLTFTEILGHVVPALDRLAELDAAGDSDAIREWFDAESSWLVADGNDAVYTIAGLIPFIDGI